MKTFLADIIPSIQRFSQKLDDLTKLTNQHWVSLGEITESKKVYIFRANGQLLISENGIVEKGTWEYLGNQSLLLNTTDASYLLKHGFFDENVIALKLDSTNKYAFFVNETRYDKELNSVADVLEFLKKRYLSPPTVEGLNDRPGKTVEEKNFGYYVLSEEDAFSWAWGNHVVIEVRFDDGTSGTIYQGKETGNYFYYDVIGGKIYCKNKDEAIFKTYQYGKRGS